MAAQSFCQLGLFAYFELNRDYIARVLCINRDNYNPQEPEITMCGGQCFLKKNLKLVEESSTQDESAPASRLKIEIPSFVLSDHTIVLSVDVTSNELHFTPYLVTNSSGIPISIFHPPLSVSWNNHCAGLLGWRKYLIV